MLLHSVHHLNNPCGLHTTQKFDKVHCYLYLTTDSPSYKNKHCCLFSLLLVTKCYGTDGRKLAMYCADAIKTPPNIESIPTLLFLCCILKLVQLPLIAPCIYGGYYLEYCTDATIFILSTKTGQRNHHYSLSFSCIL